MLAQTKRRDFIPIKTEGLKCAFPFLKIYIELLKVQMNTLPTVGGKPAF